MKINRNKILLRLLKNITEYEDFDDALLSTLSQLKINQDKFYDIKQDLLPKGLSSLMKELNLIINQIQRNLQTMKAQLIKRYCCIYPV